MSTTTPILDAAMRYASYGLAVLPCDGKLPTLTEHGFKDASTDIDVIREWLTRYPHANIGVVPGSARLLVIDIDVKGDADGYDSLDLLEAEHGALPETRNAVTPSGGEHRYFKVPEGEIFGNRKPAEGIDIRCDAGFVVAPPSVIDSNPYRWTNRLGFAPLPDAWVDLLRDKPYEPVSSETTAPTCGNGIPDGKGARIAYLKRAYDDELDQLLNAPDGDGNNQVCRYGFCLGQLVEHGMREDNIRAGAEWVFGQWSWRKRGDINTARRTLESGIAAGKASPRKGVTHD